MDFLNQLLIICPLVFLGGLIDSVAGGGGLITVPAYLVAGVPPHMALASNKCSSTFGTMVASVRFFLHGKADLKVAGVSVVFALIGSALGTKAVLLLNPAYIKPLLIVIIPIIAILVLVKKNFGQENKVGELGKKKTYFLSALAGFVIGFYDGFFGPGTGTFLVLIYAGLLKYDLITATGNAKFVNLASNLASLVVFIINGKVLFALALPAAVFGIAGNYIGAGLAIKKGAKIIKPMFIVALLLLLSTMIKEVVFG